MRLTRRTMLSTAAVSIAPGMSPSSQELHFGPDFAFGVSSSNYQIEGAVHDDGRGTGIWDVFCHTPGHIWHNGNADIACDHYHRMPEDVALMANAGLRNYRFSVSWPRLFPAGSGTPNEAGFDFYDRLLDQLRMQDITPWLCLYHWDLPQALEVKGGWTSRETSYRYAEFAGYVSHRYRDRVAHWMMLNEATVQSMFGYGMGTHAPGRKGKANWFAALHHLNLGQGMGIQALRANNVPGRIGTVACVEPIRASTESEADLKAAAMFDAVWNGSVLDPLFKGHYPALVAEDFAPLCKADDLKTINQKIDLLGVNYYSRLHVQADSRSPIGANFGPSNDSKKFTVMGWPIEPDGLYETMMHINKTYDEQEVFISENGYATTYGQAPDGNEIVDPGRITYLSEHLKFLKRSIDDGAKVSGYFVWAFLDSFEWNDGMKWHFGLVNVDFETLRRTPKQSYSWYAQLVKANARTAI
jgi:beta-glucosidase